MLTIRTYKEHSTRWQPSAAKPVGCSLGLNESTTKYFVGRLGQPMSIDNRQTKQ